MVSISAFLSSSSNNGQNPQHGQSWNSIQTPSASLSSHSLHQFQHFDSISMQCALSPDDTSSASILQGLLAFADTSGNNHSGMFSASRLAPAGNSDFDVSLLQDSINQPSMQRAPPPPYVHQKDTDTPANHAITTPYTDLDVLCGRGHTGNTHPGNQWYLQERDRRQPEYFAAPNTKAKTAIRNELVQAIHDRGGQFLKCENGNWFEIDIEIARKKASQALREKREKNGTATTTNESSRDNAPFNSRKTPSRSVPFNSVSSRDASHLMFNSMEIMDTSEMRILQGMQTEQNAAPREHRNEANSRESLHYKLNPLGTPRKVAPATSGARINGEADEAQDPTAATAGQALRETPELPAKKRQRLM